MELSRQEYPALLATLHPSQATAVLNDRIRLINKTHADIADFLQERRRLEETYAASLRKLAGRQVLDNGAALGIFQIPWQRILNATETLATSHETLGAKIEEDVERPLREYHSKSREMQSLPGIQSDLSGLAKSVETAQKKVERAKEKSAKSPKLLASAVASAEEVNEQWNSRAPFVFEQLQAADESRLNHLRDVLTQLETHEIDHVERSRQAAESCLNVLLNVQTADEIKTFAAKMAGSRIPRSQPTSRRQLSQSEVSTSSFTSPDPAMQQASDRTPPVLAPPLGSPLSPPPRIQDDDASQRSVGSDRFAAMDLPPAPEAQPRHTPLGGLRRLGTVMNRRRSMMTPSTGNFERKSEKKRSPFSAFKRNDREMQIPEFPPQTASDRDRERPSTAFTEDGSMRSASVANNHHVPETAAHNEVSQPINALNGNTPDSQPGFAGGFASNGVSSAPIDSEGYTERPSTVDEITRAQREASGFDESSMNLTIRDQPIFEDESQAKQAMDDMANTLRLRAQNTGGMRRNAGTIRGRRDVRNTMFMLNPTPDMTATQAANESSGPTSPVRHTSSPSISTNDDRAMSDTTSIRSGHTAHGHVSLHPELHQPGLNASIVETVNAWFSGGNVTKASVIGELALANNPAPGAPTDTLRVHLDNFAVLEKVAANPGFVQEVVSEDKRGEYDVQLGNISRTVPTVAFKYQMHLTPGNSSAYCPVIFKPVWNLQEQQASAIIFYHLNPAFATNVDSIIIKNLVLTVGLDVATEDEVTKQPRDSVAHATSAVMYPNAGATFRRKNSSVIWRIPELEFKALGSGDNSKFLVRFTTNTGTLYKGNVEAKFEVHSTGTNPRLGISRPVSSGQKEIDPFADEEAQREAMKAGPTAWQELPTARKLVSGKYVSS
ncbi:hypothetical protein N7495_002390 [Penicillium taxi]|uniref:uncharacterized protein n=1 Tax=Penicillium taxi TaxID=168475 RepID=UPI0025450755|nr:uncharacterized protein N7495_002390 [Penicillium taxi]KAJ5901862.1 hypothetical protein N7495_002390 [Penicillium taxi]